MPLRFFPALLAPGLSPQEPSPIIQIRKEAIHYGQIH